MVRCKKKSRFHFNCHCQKWFFLFCLLCAVIFSVVNDSEMMMKKLKNLVTTLLITFFCVARFFFRNVFHVSSSLFFVACSFIIYWVFLVCHTGRDLWNIFGNKMMYCGVKSSRDPFMSKIIFFFGRFIEKVWQLHFEVFYFHRIWNDPRILLMLLSRHLQETGLLLSMLEKLLNTFLNCN